MVVIVNIIFKHKFCHVLKELRKTKADVEVEVLENRVVDNHATHLVKLKGENKKLREAVEHLKKSRNLRIKGGRLSKNSYIALIMSETCEVCKYSSYDPEVIFLRTTVSSNGTSRLMVLTTRKKAQQLANYFKTLLGEEGVEIIIERPFNKAYLTPLQERVLLTAVRAGYYDVPRRVNLDELASMLNMSKSSVAEVLRRAEAKAVWRALSEL